MKTLFNKPIHLDQLRNGKTEVFVFYSEVMRNLYENIVKLAQTENNILLVGEQGTGKSRIAKLIYSLGSDGPFGKLFCNSWEESIQEKLTELERIPETEIFRIRDDFAPELLSGGTLFLNSFSGLSYPNWKILLKHLHNIQQMAIKAEGRRNFRIIISVEKKPNTELAAYPFWNDLLRQLNPSIVRIPPLRERCEDILLLIDQFLIDYARRNNTPVYTISRHVAYKCLSYYWPGNIRQLKNMLEHAATIVPPGSVITSDKLPFSIDWKSPRSRVSTDKENNKSFLRAKKLLEKQLTANSDLTVQELEKIEYESRLPYRNQNIYLS